MSTATIPSFQEAMLALQRIEEGVLPTRVHNIATLRARLEATKDFERLYDFLRELVVKLEAERARLCLLREAAP